MEISIEKLSQSHCACMIQDDTHCSDSIASQSSTALVTQLVEVWDIYLEYLTTHTSMQTNSVKFKRYSLLLEDIKKRVCMREWACGVCVGVFFTLTIS